MKLNELYKRTGTEYKTVLERFCNDESMLCMFVKAFPDDPTFQRLTEAVESSDYTLIESQAHALKGVSANLGFEQLQAACSELVLDVRKNRFESISQHFETVKQAYKTIRREIQRID